MDERVVGWLETLGVGKYASVFAENEITFEVLPRLTDADLKELGLPLGPRRVLSDALAALASSTAADDVPEAATLATGRGAAERRQLTVMFVDLVGSTTLSARLDPEEMGRVLGGYRNAVANEVARFEGHVAKFMGDGVLAYFGWPRAHEDEAERAVRAGLAIVDAVARLDDGLSALACRVGIATGLVVVGELIGDGAASEESVVGETPNLAARLQALAAPGQIVVAETTRRLLGAGFLLDDLGVQALKGIDGTVGAFAVTGERVLASRFEGRATGLQPMVGRDQELALLMERWAQAEAGEGQAVLLVGEAGVGKSRISRALLDALGPEPHTRIRYQCSPYHGDTALWPIVQQFGHAAGFTAEEAVESRLDKLEALLARSGQGNAAAPLIAELLGLDGSARYGGSTLSPQARRARTLEALTGQLVGLAARQAVLLLIEDVHWIDPTTLELVELCLDATSSAPVLMLLTTRPDQQPALAAHPHVTRLSLNRLGRASAVAIVAGLGGGHLPQATIDTIIARTDGVPLYVEELTKAVLETGEAAIPASLHDSLMARLDRLPEVKEVAQIAACVGREFEHGLLAAITDQPAARLAGALDKLVAAELVFRRGRPPDARYTFKHALVRDAAYESLLKTRRRELHGRIADVLQERFAGLATEEPELVARHLTEAGLADAAIPFWLRAGERAARSSANVEAVAHFRQAIRLIEAMPPSDASRVQELRLHTLMMGPLIATRGYWSVETLTSIDRAVLLLQDGDEASLHFSVLYGQILHAMRRSGYAAALEVAERFVRRADDAGDGGALLVAHRLRGLFLFFVGRVAPAARAFDTALSLYAEGQHEDLTFRYGQNQRVAIRVNRAITTWVLGYPERAASDIALAVDEGRRSGHANTLGYALAFGALQVFYCRREVAAVDQAVRELLGFAGDLGLEMWQAFARVGAGWSRSMAGEANSGLELVCTGLASLEATDTLYFRPLMLLLLAEAQLAQGAAREALVTLDEALAIATRLQDLWLEPELRRRRSLVLLQLGAPAAEITTSIATVLEMAKGREAHSWELRAATSLARLLAESGDRQQAVDRLAPVHGWFTEGFDTLDLVEAKALLDELQ